MEYDFFDFLKSDKTIIVKITYGKNTLYEDSNFQKEVEEYDISG